MISETVREANKRQERNAKMKYNGLLLALIKLPRILLAFINIVDVCDLEFWEIRTFPIIIK